MNLKFVSIVILVAGLAAIGIFQATRQTSSPVTLASVLASSTESIPRVRVAGKVSADSVEYTLKPEMILKFRLQDPGKGELPKDAPSVAVIYRGVKPDMFAAGRDVIVDGNYGDGVLTASNLLTQCPSKYEPPKPGSKN